MRDAQLLREISVQPVLMNKQEETCFALAHTSKRQYSRPFQITTVGTKGSIKIKVSLQQRQQHCLPEWKAAQACCPGQPRVIQSCICTADLAGCQCQWQSWCPDLCTHCSTGLPFMLPPASLAPLHWRLHACACSSGPLSLCLYSCLQLGSMAILGWDKPAQTRSSPVCPAVKRAAGLLPCLGTAGCP